MLAYHYLQALELAEAAGARDRAEELRLPARRFLALAGERALGLDTAQAQARLTRALELTPPQDPERADLLVRWADAAFQGGQPREAADALEEAFPALRDRGETEAAARALQIRSRLSLRLAEGRQVELAAAAVDLLEKETPGPALVEAYSQLANAHWIGGHWAESIAASERAMSLARQLELPEPARALGYHGFARSYLGEAEGLDEMQRGLELLVERGAGRDAAILRNNLAVARYPVDGPRRSLAAFEEGITFCEQRGLREAATTLEANCPGLLVELGCPQEALERAARLAAATEASGDTWSLCELRAVELANRVSRGDQEAHMGVDWLIETVRTISAADVSAFALATAAAALATGAPQRARALLVELEQAPGTHETPYYGRYLPAMVRTALAVGDRPLAERLAEGLKPRQPFDDHARCAARAQLAEDAGGHAEAAGLYGEAAARWQQFGNVPEGAYALLGQGRCLLALGESGAQEPLREARELFGSMGYKPALAETQALLEHTTAPAS